MKTWKQVASELANAHRKSDPATTTIKVFPPGEEEAETAIRLVEVSNAAPVTNEVRPFRFGAAPSSGVDFPSIVVVLCPKEWSDVLGGILKLPNGWDLASAEDL
jgi:hypothetical protein